MPAAYISLGVISTPEEAARLREMDAENPYITAIEAEVVRYAGLPEKPPEAPEASGEADSAKEGAEPEMLKSRGGGN